MPNYPHHIIQRGHNRQVVFATKEDYLYYLENLKEWKEALRCKIYAYCLMTNHVPLLIDPCHNTENLAVLMKRISSRQTRYINKVQRRSATLWEGCYKSSPIDKDEYLLACTRYIELNPVRAGIVDEPEDYRWSSYGQKVGKEPVEWLDLDPFYAELGLREEGRANRYRGLVKRSIPEGEWTLIRQAVQRGQLTGSKGQGKGDLRMENDEGADL